MAETISKQISLTSSVIKEIVNDGNFNDGSRTFSEWITLVMDSSQIAHNIPLKQMFRTLHTQIVMIYYGEASVNINFKDYKLKRGALLVMPMGTLFSIKARKGRLQMHILDYDIPSTMKPDFFIYSVGIIELGSKDYKRINNFFMLLNQSLQEKEKLEKSINCIVHALLYDINAITDETSRNMLINHSKKEVIYYDFISMLIREQDSLVRSVAHYAEQLNVSVDYLSGAVKETSGFSAMEWINKVTIDLSKIHLKEKKLSISELAHKMGFVKHNSFTRFFKKHTGQTPMEYRNGKGIPEGEAEEKNNN